MLHYSIVHKRKEQSGKTICQKTNVMHYKLMLNFPLEICAIPVHLRVSVRVRYNEYLNLWSKFTS